MRRRLVWLVTFLLTAPSVPWADDRSDEALGSGERGTSRAPVGKMPGPPEDPIWTPPKRPPPVYKMPGPPAPPSPSAIPPVPPSAIPPVPEALAPGKARPVQKKAIKKATEKKATHGTFPKQWKVHTLDGKGS